MQWYQSRFRCEVAYEDDSSALLRFANSSLALVTEGDRPAHIGFVAPAALNAGPLKTHRDGTRSVYVTDPSGNAVELLDPASACTIWLNSCANGNAETFAATGQTRRRFDA